MKAELAGAGKNILLAYGGGSIKKNGIYDEIMELLSDMGKTVTEFSGIMANPTYKKVQEGAAVNVSAPVLPSYGNLPLFLTLFYQIFL